MNKDNLIVCKRCGSDACYTQKVGKITLYSCYGCCFQTSTIMKRGEKFFEEQMDILPDLYKALLGEDEDGLIWMPQTVNLPQNGMVFATPAKEFGDEGGAVGLLIPSSVGQNERDMLESFLHELTSALR